MTPQARLLVSLLVLVGVYAVGVAGYALIEQKSLFDAAYMAAITISTVGYKEHIELDAAGRAWTIAFILFGVVGAAYASTSLVTLFVSGDLQKMLGRRKLQAQIERLKDHVILCGYGRMGALTVEQLKRRQVPLVVIEHDASACAKLKDEGTLFVQGDATEEADLLLAGLMQCRALVAGLPRDSDNVYITLTARGIRPNLTIIARAEQPSTEPKLKRAGASRVVCPQIVGATKVINILTRPNVVDFIEVATAGLELEVDEFVVDREGPLCNKTLREVPIRATGAMVVAIKRGDGQTIYNPEPGEYIRPGDTLILIGASGVCTRLQEFHASSSPTPDR